MTTRRRIVTPSAKATSSVRVLRRRRNVEDVPDSNGDVIQLPDGEDFTLKLLKKSPVSLNNFRAGEYLHVSDLLGKCVRKIALSEKFSVAMPSSFVHESMALTFAQGTAIHDYVKNRVLKGHPDKIYGTWECRCGHTHTGPMTYARAQKNKCRICGGVPDTYHELALRDPDLKIVGSPDITIYLEDYKLFYPIEIKSINHEDWKELARPKPDHVLQVLFYWYLFKKLGYSVPDQISILYVTKGFVFKTPYKEFLVSPQTAIHRLDEYIEEARALKDAREGGSIPARSYCSSRDCKDAKECHVSTICFQHD